MKTKIPVLFPEEIGSGVGGVGGGSGVGGGGAYGGVFSILKLSINDILLTLAKAIAFEVNSEFVTTQPSSA